MHDTLLSPPAEGATSNGATTGESPPCTTAFDLHSSLGYRSPADYGAAIHNTVNPQAA